MNNETFQNNHKIIYFIYHCSRAYILPYFTITSSTNYIESIYGIFCFCHIFITLYYTIKYACCLFFICTYEMVSCICNIFLCILLKTNNFLLDTATLASLKHHPQWLRRIEYIQV